MLNPSKLSRAVLFSTAMIAAGTLTMPAHAAEFSGSVQFADYVELGAEESGTVTSVKAVAGDRVAKGAVLVALDSRASRARLKAAEVAVAVAENSLAVAEREKERAEELYDRGSLSDHDLTLAGNAHTEAEAALAMAEAKKTSASIQVQRSVLRAPFAARVLTVKATRGQAVINGLQAEPLVAVAASDRFRIRVPVRAAQFVSVNLGTEVSAKVGDKSYTGKVSGVAYEAGQQAPFAVYVSVPLAGDERIPLGQGATVELP